MSEVVVDKVALRNKLRTLLQKVPKSVTAGSYQRTVEYKKRHAEASKVAISDRATATQLQSAINQMTEFE